MEFYIKEVLIWQRLFGKKELVNIFTVICKLKRGGKQWVQLNLCIHVTVSQLSK